MAMDSEIPSMTEPAAMAIPILSIPFSSGLTYLFYVYYPFVQDKH